MCLERRRRIAVMSLAVFIFGVALVIVFNVYLLSSVHSSAIAVDSDRVVVNDDITTETIMAVRPRHKVKLVMMSRQEQLRRRWRNLSDNWTAAGNEPILDIDERRLMINNVHELTSTAPSKTTTTKDAVQQWVLAGNWVQPREIYPSEAHGLTDVLKALSTQPIIKADVFKRGTQLKIFLLMKGGQKAIMKPMRYSRDTVFQDTPYAGADRHNGEIAAFHLSRLLDFRWCPLTSGRVVDLNRDILPVADKQLSETFFKQGGDTCFYGVCHFCNRHNSVCAPNGILEAALIMWLPVKYRLKLHRHPWARTYKADTKAEWETRDDYCQRVKKITPYGNVSRLLDLIDVAIFDFLIGNADRHRYETFEAFSNASVILLDNGKSFGNPYEDEISILAPLYQCCTVRSSTVDTLRRFPGRKLSAALESLLKIDPLYPLLTDVHLYALDRRRYKVLDAINWCLESHVDVLKTGKV